MFRILILALALLVPSALAQDDACTEASPCEWVIEVDADGYTWNTPDGPIYNGTLGDWYRFSILNADDQAHTMTWPEYGLSWTIDGPDLMDTEPFQLTLDGQFFLEDVPTGDDAILNVFIADVVDQEQAASPSEDGPGVSQPGPAVVLVGLALLALVAVSRR